MSATIFGSRPCLSATSFARWRATSSSTSTTYSTSVSIASIQVRRWSEPRPPQPTTATPSFSLGPLMRGFSSAASTRVADPAATAAAAANIESSRNCRRVRLDMRAPCGSGGRRWAVLVGIVAGIQNTATDRPVSTRGPPGNAGPLPGRDRSAFSGQSVVKHARQQPIGPYQQLAAGASHQLVTSAADRSHRFAAQPSRPTYPSAAANPSGADCRLFQRTRCPCARD